MADRKGFAMTLDLKVLLVGDIRDCRRMGASHHIAFPVRNTDVEQEFRRQQGARLEIMQYRRRTLELIREFDELQGLIDFSQGAHDLGFIGLDQFPARRRCGPFGTRTLDFDASQVR